jgi:putative Ig domain-containing protein/FG-GAP repeat protein
MKSRLVTRCFRFDDLRQNTLKRLAVCILLLGVMAVSLGGTCGKVGVIRQVGPLTINTSSPLPTSPVNQVYGSSIQASGGTTPYAWSEVIPPNGSSNLSPGMTFTTQGVVGAPPDGLLSGTPTAPGIFTFTAQVTDSAQTPALVSKPFTFAISPPGGTLGQAYSQTLMARGGSGPYKWAVVSGSSLPSGLALSSGGVLSGTPTSAGTFTFTLQTTDSSSPAVTTSGALSLTITGSTVTITTASLPSGVVGTAYGSQTLNATGGTTPYSWSWSAVGGSSLPPGLVLSSGGVITGTPTASGTFTVAVQAQDSSSLKQSANKSLSIVINGSNNPVPTITSLSPSSATVGSPSFSLTINGTNFISGATVTFGTSNLSNPLVNAQGTQITVTVPASDLANPAQVKVTATNPAPGGGPSNQFTFTVAQQVTYTQTAVQSAGMLVAIDQGLNAADNNNGVAVIGRKGTLIPAGNSFATVFIQDTMGNWSSAAQLSAPAGTAGFLASLAISGDGNTIVAGFCPSPCGTGVAYVYTASSNVWTGTMTQPATLTANPNRGVSNFGNVGFSVAVDFAGDTIAIGAPGSLTLNGVGVVSVFLRQLGGWASKSDDAQLTDTAPDVGVSVAIDAAGNTIVTGAEGFGTATNAGAAFVFVKPSGPEGWAITTNNGLIATPTATLAQTGAVLGDYFGRSVAISGDGHTVVVGSPNHPNCTEPCNAGGPGAAYVFVNNLGPSNWATLAAQVAPNPITETSTLAASNGKTGDALGLTTSISDNGSVIVAGAPSAPNGSCCTAGPGAVYVFQISGGAWNGLANETQALTATATQIVVPQSQFGASVFVAGDASSMGSGGFATVSGMAGQQVVYMFQ